MKPSRPLVGLVAAVHAPLRPDGSRGRRESLGFFDWIRPSAPP
jgi:hypothetical protein